jgi:tetratricopeptide (TPR) repeat protein
MHADGTGDRTETLTVAVQSEAAVKQYSVVGTIYAKQSQHADLVYVRVRHADGTTVETPPGDVQDQAAPVTQQAPFYSDLMIKQIPVKGLRVGDTLEWQTHSVSTVAEAPGQFWGAENFSQAVVIEDQTIELRVPSGLKLTVWTKPDAKLQLAESDSNGQHVYHWTWKQLDPTVGPVSEALKKEKKSKPMSPAEQEDAIEGALPDVAWTTFPSWEAVGAWYRGLEGERMQPDAAIRAKVAEITAGKTTQDEKVRAVYAWVSGQIRYVGVALGIGRYQPHTAAAVLDNQYGDCKDKHTLLASMLLAMGLHPDAVLAGPGIRFDRAVPSPASFNHLITRVSVEGKDVWLDSTSEVADFGVLLAAVRDKDVLVMPQNGPATIAHTPVNLPFKPESTFAVSGSLNGALASDSTITITHHDDPEVFLRAALRQTSPSSYEELIQALMANYGFGGKVSEVEIEHVSDPSQPLTIRFHYHREHAEDWGENRVTATFGPTLLPIVDKADLPRSPLELGTPRTDSSKLEMKLPQGWDMEVPEAVHQQIPQAECKISYRLKDGVLSAERRMTILQPKVPVSDMNAYAGWYEACGAGSVPFLQLTKVSPTNATVASSSTTQARKLILQADNQIHDRKYDEADTSLKQAQALDENAQDLWGDFGAIAMHRGDRTEAIRLYAKEMNLHPESDFAYRNLARLQNLAGDKAAALDTLMRWQKRVPANPAPAIQAVQMLHIEHDDAGALKQARVFEALLTENAQKQDNFRLALGKAEIDGGDVDAGRLLLRTIATDSLGLNWRNDASYELAEEGLDLPAAEQAERTVLGQLATETRAWTGNEAPAILRQKTLLTTACWDTMAWILFKEGKAAEAEAWIRPAMMMRGNTEIGEHLGDILMAEKKPADAATAYAEAVAALPTTGAWGTQANNDTPEDRELRSKLNSAKDSAKLAQLPDGHAGLQAMRVWELGPANGLTGTAEFTVLISSQGIAFAQPIGTVPQAMQERIKAAKWSNRFPPEENSLLATKVRLDCQANSCKLTVEP